MKERWYTGPLYYWHLDYYLSADSPDAFECFNPERISSEIAAAGTNLVAVFALNQHGYAYYPSKIAPLHPKLRDLDYTSELIRAFRKRNMRILVYVNYMNIDLRNKHPDWWQRDSNDSIVFERGWTMPCPNGPVREYMGRIFQEITELYEIDGFFFDMFQFNKGGCYCENCRKAFKNSYALDLPIDENWGSEEWRKFVEFRYQSAYKAAKEIRDLVKAIKPDLAWITHCNPFYPWSQATGLHLSPKIDDIVFTEVATGYGKYRWAPGEMGKLLVASSRGKPCIVNLADLHARCGKSKGWFYIPNSGLQLKLGVAEIVANGCWPSIYMEPYPDSRHNPYTNQGIKECFSMVRKFEPYLTDSEQIKSVALHFSKDSYDFYGKDNPEDYLHSFRGMYKALMESHIPFDVILDDHITDGRIKDYHLCIMSNSSCISGEVNTALAEYINSGGSLFATHATSLYDERGRVRSDFGLREMLGVSYQKSLGSAYMEINSPLNYELTSSPIPQYRVLQIQLNKNDFEVISRVILPSPTNLAPFPYIPAPSQMSALPALVRNGQVIYCAADIGCSFMRASYRDHRQLIRNIVDLLIGRKLLIQVNAPSTLDMTLRKQDNQILIHLINLTTNQVVEDADCSSDIYDIIPLHDIEIEFFLKNIKKVYQASNGQSLPCTVTKRGIEFRVPKVELYEIVRLVT